MQEGPETTEPAVKEDGGPTQPQSGGEADRRPKASIRFIAWIGRQSLPRLLGLIFGNTRELERSLERAEGELLRLRGEYSDELGRLRTEAEAREKFFRKRFRELSDSILMSKGLLPASAEARGMVSGQAHRPIEPKNSPKQMEMEAEADRLLEMLQRGDVAALNEKVEDMLQSNRPQDKRILQLFDTRAAELERHVAESDIGVGVIVGPPEARVS